MDAGDCDHCHAKPWKYRLRDERNRSVQIRLCENCYTEVVPTMRGVFKVEERRSGDE